MHNAYVEVIAETGIVGLVLFLIFVVTAFRRIRHILKDPSLSADALAYARCAAAIILGVAVWFNDNAVFGIQPETVLLAVMLGVVAAIPAVDRRTNERVAESRPVAWSTLFSFPTQELAVLGSMARTRC